MDRPLKDHIAALEQKIEKRRALQNNLSFPAAERYQAVIDLDFAERALASFRQAYDLEKKVLLSD
ncbi:hypothetical protein DYQ86_04650 [Acidobacteria bacterium AB60]|nr:hypothetical protein DYQ86_04650 [Acidobacteria bacterium AB60]